MRKLWVLMAVIVAASVFFVGCGKDNEGSGDNIVGVWVLQQEVSTQTYPIFDEENQPDGYQTDEQVLDYTEHPHPSTATFRANNSVTVKTWEADDEFTIEEGTYAISGNQLTLQIGDTDEEGYDGDMVFTFNITGSTLTLNASFNDNDFEQTLKIILERQ